MIAAGMIAVAAGTVLFTFDSAQAQFLGGTGHETITTVEQARNARNGVRVSLTGSLKSELRRAHYRFQDSTGEIRVRIEYEFWRGRAVTDQNVLKLAGRVQSDVRGRFIDVYYFHIIQ